MRYFLDMNIIIFYSGTSDVSEYIDMTKRFVNSKEDNIFQVCYYILDNDLPRWIKRQDIIINELRRKFKDPGYEIGSLGDGKRLWPRDINKAKKLFYTSISHQKKERFLEVLIKINLVMKRKIDHFIKNLVDQKVIHIKEIDFDLYTNINSILNNESDSRIIASGIQQHNKEELVMFTSDKKHWTRDNILVVYDSRIEERYPKVPEIRYLQDI